MKFVTVLCVFLVFQGTTAGFLNPFDLANAINSGVANIANNMVNGAVKTVNNVATGVFGSGAPTNLVSGIGNIVTGFVNVSSGITGGMINGSAAVTNGLINTGAFIGNSIGAVATTAVNVGFSATTSAFNDLQTVMNAGVHLTQDMLQGAVSTLSSVSSSLLSTVRSTVSKASLSDLINLLVQTNFLLNTTADISVATNFVINNAGNISIHLPTSAAGVVTGPIVQTAANVINVADLVLDKLRDIITTTVDFTLNGTYTIYRNVSGTLLNYVNHPKFNSCAAIYDPQIKNQTSKSTYSVLNCGINEINSIENTLDMTRTVLQSANTAISTGTYSVALVAQIVGYGATVTNYVASIASIQTRIPACLSAAAAIIPADAAILSAKIVGCFVL